MLNTVKYIKEHGLENLISTYKLIANWSKRHPNLVQLCYDQLETPKNEITNECRGLILDTTDDFKVISYPFYRFSDYVEDKSDKALDLSSLKFYEKLDGSIITLYFYGGEWNISTKTMPDADGRIRSKDAIFRDYFFSIFKNLRYELPTDTTKCYVFEFMFDGQGIVVKNKESISLLMVRDLITYQELDHIEAANTLGYDKATPIQMTLDEAKKIIRYLDPIECEGYVVCDKNNTRFKIKSPQFDKISELKVNWDNTEERQQMIERDNFRKLCDIVRTNDHTTFIQLEKYSSLSNQFKEVKDLYTKLLNDTQIFINKVDGLEGKELGMVTKGKDKYLNGLAFGIAQGRINKNADNYLEDYFYEMNIKSFEEIIKKLK